MNNLILNEKYSDTKNFFEVAKGDKIFYKNKNLIDLSSCSGVLILGHNSFVFKKSGFENNSRLKTSKDWGGIIRYVYVFKKTDL